MSTKGDSAAIQTYLRVRPSKRPSGFFSVDDSQPNVIVFRVPDKLKEDYVNNSKLENRFLFNGILEASATQEQVFNEIGASVVMNALDGFNSTIFAYGQTGSGKTYTLTGDEVQYTERGIIPRSISMLFREFRARPQMQYRAYISYLEIYNEEGYDLLGVVKDNTKDTTTTLAKGTPDLPIPKVRLLEDDAGNFHLKGLSMHPVENEEEALTLLFEGDTNREISATAMNLVSSRSHCIFTLAIEAREAGGDRVRRSKLHLVDLAGSERVAKTNSSGQTLTEATYINKSLFFLEMVIVALHEKATKGRSHVPYRNSLMTSVLRDSLGGNCKTIMIATINPEAQQTEESVSTCKFAQRVALIKNNAIINEELDPAQMIRKLKGEVLNLREEISYLKGETGEGDTLSLTAQEELRNQIMSYLHDYDPNSQGPNIGKLTLNKIKSAFRMFKTIYLDLHQQSQQSMNVRNSRETKQQQQQPDFEEETNRIKQQVKDLKSLLLQRDGEINILVNMVKKGKTVEDIEGATSRSSNNSTRVGGARDSMSSSTAMDDSLSSSVMTSSTTATTTRQNRAADHAQLRKEERIIQKHLFGVPPPVEQSTLDDAALSFEYFRDHCKLGMSMNEDKELLKQKITEAKLMGERVHQCKNAIKYLKDSIEALRREKALERVSLDTDNNNGIDSLETPQEVSYRRAIEQEKNVYTESVEALKQLKPEIEHIQKLLKKSQVTLQTQFDQWFSSVHRLPLGMGQSSINNAAEAKREHNMKTAADLKGRYDQQTDDEEDDVAAFLQIKQGMMARK